ncbi:MAG: lysoplasmalogenase [Hyphomonadaceae bacterium]|nr:lysoplasmalogenase [Hyphomonadaceae bacterium]
MDLTPIYWALAAGLAVYYALRVGDPPGRTRTMVKALSVAALALVALMGGGYLLLVLALLLCAVGDAFLAQDLKRGGDGPLRAGMIAFALGHVVYIVLFANQGGGLADGLLRGALQLCVLAAAGALAWWLWPDLGAMRWPVAGYVGVVTLMALLALGLPDSLWLVTVGALLFLTSDALLAGELFKLPADSPARRWSSPAVWLLYWGGQAAITAGLLYPHR